MANRKFRMGIPALALIFVMIIAGCDDGDSGSNDPIDVDMTLPAIQDVAPFEGEFVSSEDEAKPMIAASVTALELLSGAGDLIPTDIPVALQSSRSLQTVPLVEPPIIYDNEELADGVYVTGFANGQLTSYFADDDFPLLHKGDRMEVSAREKMAITLDNAEQDSYIFNGKYIFDDDFYSMIQTTSHTSTPELPGLNIVPVVELTLKIYIANSYALSVSKEGKGIKFVMKMNSDLDIEQTIDDISEVNIEDIMSNSIKTTIDIYDNDNVKCFNRTFNNLYDLYEYLGVDLEL